MARTDSQLRASNRMVERRTRRPIGMAPAELSALLLLGAPLAAVVRAGGEALQCLARRVRLESLPYVDRLERSADQGREGAAGERAPAAVATEGGELRLRGVIEPLGPGFETPGSAHPAVFARSVFVIPPAYQHQTATYTDETRGVDFVVRLASGQAVQVAARDVRLHELPRRIWRPNLPELQRRGGQTAPSMFLGLPPLVRESAIRLGDRVEASGVLVREVAPDGDAALGRGTPLVTRLVPGRSAGHVWLRRV